MLILSSVAVSVIAVLLTWLSDPRVLVDRLRRGYVESVPELLSSVGSLQTGPLAEQVIPIPGGRPQQSIRDSAAAAELVLSQEELARCSAAVGVEVGPQPAVGVEV